jgi:hypothetical protein
MEIHDLVAIASAEPGDFAFGTPAIANAARTEITRRALRSCMPF